MRETNSNGREVIFMPRDATGTINKLAALGAVAAKRDWERAALVAMHVKPAGRGRPKTGISSGYQQDNLAEFTRRGIYGLTSEHAVRAWLKAWQSSGLPTPEPGIRLELPARDFPDLGQFYPAKPTGDEPSPDTASEDTDESDEDDYAGEASEGQNGGSPTPQPRPRPDPARSMLDDFLRILDRMDPNAVIHGQPADRRELLIKTLESWLESLRESDGLD